MLKYTSDLSTIGGRIKYYRVANKLSQEKVATYAHLDVCTIKRYENNQIEHTLETCYKIAIAIGVNPLLIYDEYLIFVASNYGKQIKSVRQRLNLTQSQFAAFIGVNRKTIIRWEKEKLHPSRKFYYDYLHSSLHYFEK
jgi:transcriptional regulator with XRE-family HTH domain